jgi:hypothetical protein
MFQALIVYKTRGGVYRQKPSDFVYSFSQSLPANPEMLVSKHRPRRPPSKSLPARPQLISFHLIRRCLNFTDETASISNIRLQRVTNVESITK